MKTTDLSFPFILVSLIHSILAVAGICSVAWLQFGDSSYFVNTELMWWENATSFCRQLNGSLAFPDSQAEQDFLWGIYAEHFAPITSNNYGPWIGCDDRDEEGEWQCTSAYDNWARNQPDDYKDGEDCTEFSLSWEGKWNDVPCDEDRFSVCEVRTGEPWAVCQASTGSGFTNEAQCVFSSAEDLEALAVSRVIWCWRACRSDAERRSFNLQRLGSGEVVCQSNE